MTTYSHSKVSTYDNCPYAYKLRYIDKKKPETYSTTIEAFMGSMVHEALEYLYKLKKFKKRTAKASVLKFYNAGAFIARNQITNKLFQMRQMTDIKSSVMIQSLSQ